MKWYYLPLILVVLSLTGCQKNATTQAQQNPAHETEEFKNYWHSGKAEIASYKLDQARYGETHSGNAVLIFVTEPFSKKKQVKLDDYTQAGNDHVSVLKLNFTKNFVTGIYPYSMMLSVFTPVEVDPHPSTLKITMSSQEWCGHVFSQVNRKGNKYAIQSYSYFEQESDKSLSLPAVLLEDEIWNLIRLNPSSLPIGEVDIIPGMFFTRLQHKPYGVLKALLAREEDDSYVIYSIEYPSESRKLSIKYEKQFPHKIIEWEETFLQREKTMTTKAVLDTLLYTDYWTKNKKEFRYLYDSLTGH